MQERLNTTERELDVQNLENLKLKCLNFDLDLKVSDFTI